MTTRIEIRSAMKKLDRANRALRDLTTGAFYNRAGERIEDAGDIGAEFVQAALLILRAELRQYECEGCDWEDSGAVEVDADDLMRYAREAADLARAERRW